MSEISPSSIQETPELIEAVKNAGSQAEIQQIMRQAALDQRLVVPDAYDPNVLTPTVPGTAPGAFAKRLSVNGQTVTLEAASEAELLAKENEFLRQTFAGQPAVNQPTQNDDAQLRDDNGRFVSPTKLDAAEKAALDVEFRLGHISLDDYLQKSGAIDAYIDKNPALREVVQQADGKRIESGWQSATERFLNSAEGADWPGGEQNKETLGKLLIQSELHGEPSFENIVAAYEYMKEHNLLVISEERKLRDAIESAQNPMELRQALDATRPAQALWGR